VNVVARVLEATTRRWPRDLDARQRRL